jgi:hypothetical protein
VKGRQLCEDVPMSEDQKHANQAKPASELDHIAEWAYNEAVRGISQQRSSLDDLRTRTGAVLSAGILATAFLGAFAVKGTGHGLATRFYGPVILFIIATILCILVLLPMPGWFYTLDVRARLDDIDTANPPTLFEVYNEAVTLIKNGRESNSLRLNLMSAGFALASGIIAAEIIWWLVEVI